MKDKLVIEDHEHRWYIQWYIADDQDLGGCLGQGPKDGTGDEPKERADWEHWAASKAVREGAKPDGRDNMGFYWESRAKAQGALRLAKEAIKRGRAARPLPAWTQAALAAGWKAPNGWEP